MAAETQVAAQGVEVERRIAGLTPDAWRMAATAVVVAIGVILPWGLGSFELFQLTLVLIYGIAILGLNILTGFNGQFSLGHSAFFAVGAYTSAILIEGYGVNAYLTIPMAGLAGFAVGFLFGFPALRLSGLYLALATFALSVATPQLLKYNHFERSEEHTSELQSLMRISYAVFCLKNKTHTK